MLWIVIKYLTTAAIVVLVSEVAKRSDKMGTLVAALPTVTILALVWMYIEGRETANFQIMLFILFGMCYQHYQCFCSFLIYWLNIHFGSRC